MAAKYISLSEDERIRGIRLQICNDDNVSVSVLQYKLNIYP